MSYPNKQILDTFTEETLPDLDVVTLGALELLGGAALPNIDTLLSKRTLVVGSGNAGVTGRIIFDGVKALHADEGTYKQILSTAKESLDSAVLISASGGKHAVEIAEELKRSGLMVHLMTTNSKAEAAVFVDKDRWYTFPKNREPYTYNTSTYMSMLLAKTGESPAAILAFLMEDTARRLPDTLGQYDAFYCIIPPEFAAMREMFTTKFDELFGAKVSGRVFTYEQTKHAKTVVPGDNECFISFGAENTTFGIPGCRVHVPLPREVGCVGMMAVAYYTIGQIQKQHPPYYRDNIQNYTREASKLFGSIITPVVE
ncbi:MAG: hypothetical protein LR017_00350 [Candidatus Pacebacteria bacterium]|nr:hypothetical protein [Candidatus Paceibacterota bacterium]